MTHTPNNIHHTDDSIDFPREDEEIRFLNAESHHASLELRSRERFAMCGCECSRCRDVLADDGPECSSLARRVQR
ncbi:MAG: hypothetical protein RLZZ396_3211 [Planctomycetota bacterium]|jgi:hypothetical protein